MTPQPQYRENYVAAQQVLEDILSIYIERGDRELAAATWLLMEHGHWAEQLITRGYVAPGLHGGEFQIRWTTLAHSLTDEDLRGSALYGTGSELAVLRVCLAIAQLGRTPLPSLTSLDDTNVRRVLYALAWAASGQDYARKLGLYAA